jgi:cytochrome c-type biogenesis protein CcmH/NrfG
LVKVAPLLPNNPLRQLQYAGVLMLLREWSDAVPLLKDVVKRLPRSSRALRLLARSHLAQQSWQEAFDCAIGSLKQNPGHARSYEILAHAMFGMGMRNQAWQAFESAIEAEPTWPRPRAALVMLARRMGKPQAQVDGYLASYQLVKQQAQEKRAALKDAACCLIDGNRKG